MVVHTKRLVWTSLKPSSLVLVLDNDPKALLTLLISATSKFNRLKVL